MSPANLCRHCGMREEWHEHGECPNEPEPVDDTSLDYGSPVAGRYLGFVIGVSLEPVAVLAAERYGS